MFQNIIRRRAKFASRLALGAALLAGTTFVASSALASTTSASAQRPTTTASLTKGAWKTQAYSKTSEFSERLLLLEFSDKTDPSCDSTTNLLNEMRRKNYPIQRVEKTAGGELLFERFQVKTAPTLVLLFDGKELGRIVVKKDDVKVTTKRLLTLFQKGRDEVAANPRKLESDSELLAQSKPFFGFLFPRAAQSSTSVRAQAPDLLNAEPIDDDAAADLSILDARTEEISNIIGETRLEGATARVYVKDPSSDATRMGLGATIHYSSEYNEALVVVAASVFADVDAPIEYPDVILETYNSTTQKLDKVRAQCVHCDPDAGVAFVAAQVDAPIKPVAFLPKKNPMELSERAFSLLRRDDGVTKSTHEIVAVDQRRFYENSAEQSAYAPFIETSNPVAEEDYGAALYLQRNGRFYFAGLFVSRNANDEGVVVPASAVSQALLVNRNLTVVYRDQIAGKFDAPASDDEIESAIERLIELDSVKRVNPVAKNRSLIDSPTNAPQLPNDSMVLSRPANLLEEKAALSVDLVAEDANAPLVEDVERVDVALNRVADPTELSDFPQNAQNAFARSAAVANLLSENSSDLFAENDVLPSTGVDADVSMPEADNLADARSQLAFSDSHVVERPVNSLTADDLVESSLAPTDDFPTSMNDSFLIADEYVAAPIVDPRKVETEAMGVADAVEPSAPSTALEVAASVQDAPLDPFFTVAESPSMPVDARERALPADALLASSQPRQTPTLSEPVRPTAFDKSAQSSAFRAEEEEFEAALEVLRRHGLEGAEIICIVNWPGDSDSVRETEIVRIPRRKILTNPAAAGAGVQLAAEPNAAANRLGAASNAAALPDAPNTRDSAPMTSNRLEARVYK